MSHHSHCCSDAHSGHSHEHHCHDGAQILTLRIIAALILFAAGMILHIKGAAGATLFILVYIIAGADVVLNAAKNIIRGKIFDENFLMTIATLGAFAIKEYPEAAAVMILYQIGEYFQHSAVEKSRNSITKLMDIRPDYANAEINGQEVRKAPQEVNINDIIIVKAGEKIPLDGVVIEGTASVDTSALTGESIPKELKKGDNAISGSLNKNGLLKIKVTKLFGESTVSKILELVENAGNKKAKTEKFITKFARYYTPAVVLAALILAVVPPLVLSGANFSQWLERALTFLVISCPCALVISVPLSFFGGIGGASKQGILIKGSTFIEALSKPYAVVFDKTGTLTKGVFEVIKIIPEGNATAEELLETAAYAENYSNHPIALSIKKAFSQDIDKAIDTSVIKGVSEIAGNGVKISAGEDEIIAGSARLMELSNIEVVPNEDESTVVYIAKNRIYLGRIVISDVIKEDSFDTIKKLKEKGIKTIILTGDSREAALSIADKLGISEPEQVYYELLPTQKVEKLEEIIEKCKKDDPSKSVIFAGDGINDAPVLMRADIGIAMGALGSDAAIEAADVVIMDDKPSKIVSAINISKKTLSIVKQNIAFSIGVKMLFLLLGALGFITMWGAVFADVGVSLIAVLNALRTLKYL